MGNTVVALSSKGFRYAAKDGIRLNSSYNPSKEAEQFIQGEIKRVPGMVILTGCTLGYLIEALQILYPGTRTLCFFYDPVLFEAAKERLGPCFPCSCLVNLSRPEDTNSFIRKNMSEANLEGLISLEWPPSGRLYPEESTFLHSVLAQRIREMNGSVTATRMFGRRWMKNTFSNFRSLERFVLPNTITHPVVITGAGPSLINSFSFLRDQRHKIFLLCLSSSLEAVTAAGLQPDGIVTTDPGYWAATLLRYAPDVPLFMPLSAALPSGKRYTASITVVGQNNFYEHVLYNHILNPPFIIPSGGTVASTAVNLAMQLTTGPVIVAGIDFSYPDIFLHCRPHPFDVLDDLHSHRLSPLLSVLWKRSRTHDQEVLPRGSRRNLPMKTYAGWFAKAFSEKKGRIYRLYPSEVEIPSFLPLYTKEADDLVSRYPEKHTGFCFQNRTPEKALREKRVSDILFHWEHLLNKDPVSLNIQGEILWKDREIFDLCYTYDIEGMLELRGLIRKAEHEKIRSVLSDMIKNLGTFIEELRQ